MRRRLLGIVIVFFMLFRVSYAEESELTCKSAILMDFETGSILYEMNPHERLAPASVTKVMTLLLTMEEIEKGQLKYTDIVTASEYAKSMGGSTIFLDAGEEMSVDDLIKGIAVSSGNDACVAIAEHISGSCDSFVEQMNKRAKELGMKDTHFVNCNGLDATEHYSSAYDIALMSRELMKHEDIFKYTTIWMDSLRDGAFTLSNTNKLVRFYDGCTGLKTGSTSQAGFCISATAKRDDIHLISVIMNAPTSKDRQRDASSLLNYGFGKYKNTTAVKAGDKIKDVSIEKGNRAYVSLMCLEDVKFLSEKTANSDYKVEYKIPDTIKAPAQKGEKVGRVICTLDGKVVGETDIVFAESVGKIDFSHSYGKIIDSWLGNKNQF